MAEEIVSREELNTALAADLKQMDDKANGIPSDAAPAPQEEAAKADVKPEAVKPADEGEAKPKAADDATGDDKDSKNPYRNRIDRLSRKTDRLEAEKETDKAEIARLKAELEKKGSDDDDADESNVSPKSVAEQVDERLKERDRASQLEKSDQEDLAALFEKNPNAKERKNEIVELSKKHPTLSYEALDQLLAPADYVDEIELNRKNARNMGTGSRSKADLANEQDPKTMKTSDMKKALLDDVKSGRLVI